MRKKEKVFLTVVLVTWIILGLFRGSREDVYERDHIIALHRRLKQYERLKRNGIKLGSCGICVAMCESCLINNCLDGREARKDGRRGIWNEGVYDWYKLMIKRANRNLGREEFKDEIQSY